MSSEGRPVSVSHSKYLLLLCIAAQLVLLVLLYGQTAGFDYVYFDDSHYVLSNSHVRSGLSVANVQWAFSSLYMSNWHPLTWISHMLDTTFFGVDPGWAHLHNAALHGVVSLLLFAYLLRLLGDWWKSLLLSLIFLVHPLHVESVAWIAERKDVLSAVFFLTGLILYDSYRQKPSWSTAAGVMLSYCLAVMAKPMAVTFPAVLLVLDLFHYRAGLFGYAGPMLSLRSPWLVRVLEKLPLFAVAALISVLAIVAQRDGGALVNTEVAPIAVRLANAAYSYATYLRQMFVPLGLAAFYPLDIPRAPSQLLLPALLLLAWITASFALVKKYPLLLAGLGWYLVMLLPVIGLIQVGTQLHADRYMYLPSIGVLLALACLIPARESKYFRVSVLVAPLFILYLAFICYWQVAYWENRHTLFTRVLTAVGPNWRAHVSLAADYTRRGMFDDAAVHAQAALEMRPDLAESYQSLGDIEMRRGEYAAAVEHYSMALQSAPPTGGLLNNLAMALQEQGQFAAAREALLMALSLEPNSVHIQANLELLDAREELP
ncbi:MAG: tetratricopeptide repeat protein [Halieaceae bacterium]